MTVRELIAILQTLPQDIPVAAINGSEDMCEISSEGITHYSDGGEEFYNSNDYRSNVEHVEIRGI